MPHSSRSPHLAFAAGLAGLSLFAACGGGGSGSSGNSGAATTVTVPAVTLMAKYTNAVSTWHDIAAATTNDSAATATTPEELRTVFNVDLATVSLAMYDASAAIDGKYKLYGPTPASPSTGASMDAAVAAAAHGVLQALFPNRAANYEDAYTSFVAGLPAGDAKDKGLALGAEVAHNILAMRANDGRSIALAAYVPGTDPGKYRGSIAVDRFRPFIKPFVLSSNDQFRPAPPPALDSAAYAADFNEVKLYGSATGGVLEPEQQETARFHTELPPTFLTRNFGWFARTTSDVPKAARLMALIYVTSADAINACFDAKYFYERWRPQSAINLADTDGNPQTSADTAWTPLVPTPPHPEYPAAHGCTAGSLDEALRQYYGTKEVNFTWDSKVTGTAHFYANTDALAEEIKLARIYGGMHFRYSMLAGIDLGTKTAAYVLQNKFGAR